MKKKLSVAERLQSVHKYTFISAHVDITIYILVKNQSINYNKLINLSPPNPSQLNNQQSELETTKITYKSFQQKMSDVKTPTKWAPYNSSYRCETIPLTYLYSAIYGGHRCFRCFLSWKKPRSARSPNAANSVLQLHPPWSCNAAANCLKLFKTISYITHSAQNS